MADADNHAVMIMRRTRICNSLVFPDPVPCSASTPLAAKTSRFHLRLQVVLLTDLVHQLQLGLEEVDVLLGVLQNALEQIA